MRRGILDLRMKPSGISLVLLALTGILLSLLTACGGSSKPVSVAVTASASTVDGTDTVTITATVTNDKNAAGVTWTVSGGGTLSNTSTTSATYTAPAATTSAQTVTVTATSIASTSETASATLTVPAAPSVSTGALSAGAVGTSYSATLTATGGIAPYTWSLASGTLPACLTLTNSASGGTITGTPTASCAGTYTITLKVTDSGSPTALTATSPSITLTIAAAPAITFTGTVPAATYNAAYTGSAAATGGAGALAYSISAGALPTGLSLSATSGAITGTPTVVGSFPFTVKAADMFGDSAANNYTLVVSYPALAVTSATLPIGYAGGNYSQTLAATGGSGTGYTWALASGSSLPAGLSLSTGGVISGKATAAGTTSFTVKVTDSASNTATGSFSITINPGVSITTPLTLPIGYVGGNYSQTLAATGGSGTGYTWAVSSGSSLPAGLTLSAAGVLSGKPTAAGTPSFSVTVTDSASNTASATFTMTIAAGVSITTPATLPNGYVGSAYSQALSATGGTGTGFVWALASGSTLPAGLSLSGNTISGSPTTAGVSTFTVTVTDSASNTASATLSLTIVAGLTITTPATLPAGYVGINYSQTLTAAGGSGTGYSFVLASGSTLPAGLTLSTAGVIGGKPTTIGSTSFTVTVTDSLSHTANATLSLTIDAALSIATAATLPTGYVGSNYAQTLAAAGGSGSGYTWAVSSGSTLPGGLALSAAGVLSGKPTAAGTPSFSVTVTDSASNTASTTFTITIAAGVTITTPPTLPSGYQGAVYSGATLAATGGTGTGYTWAWSAASGSSIPAGLNLSAGGAISGTPTASGTFSVVITVTDSAQNTASSTFSLTVEPSLSVTIASPLKSGTINTAYSQSLTATGGSGSGYTWTTNTAGTNSLAAIDLTLSAAGLVAGTPLSTGTATFTVTVTDSQSHTATSTLTVTIYASLTVTTTTLPATNVGAAYSQTLVAAGGTGTGYTWTATSSNLSTYGLSLSSAGVVSGTPTTAGTASFTANVKDSGNNTALAPLTITIYSALSLPAPDPSSLPGTATTGLAYNGTIGASGGSGNYSWSVTGLPADSLSSSSLGGTLSVIGTPTTAQTVTFSATLTDTTTNASVTQTGYNIVVTNPAALSLPTPNPSSLPSASVNASYNGSVTAIGGAGTYTWTVNGSVLSSGTVALGNGTLGIAANGNSLTITGTPNTVTPSGSPISFTASVADSAGQSTGTDTYTIAVTNLATISGTFFLPNYCGNGNSNFPVTFTVGLYNGTTLVQSTTTGNNGNYSFTNIANGTYSIQPSLSGAATLFYPASIAGLTIDNSNNNLVTGQNFNANVGFTVSGTVSYSGSQTGQTYLVVNNNNCGGNQGTGTSITETVLKAGGAFTIRGVPPGSNTITAWMDPLGQSVQNAIDPAGSVAITVNANVSNADLTMADPTFTTPTSNPTIGNIVPNSQGAVLEGNISKNSNGVEDANQYVVQWSTSPTLGGGSGAQFATVAGSYTFPARGDSGVWILSNALLAGTGFSFTSGQTYYFQARSFDTLDTANPHPAGWCNYTSTGCGGTTGFIGVTIGTPACTGTCTAVSSSVTIPAAIAINTGAPLYLGLVQLASDSGSPTGIYVTEIANPVNGANNFTVTVPSGSNYAVIGILDQKNNGGNGGGAITNTRNNLTGTLTISGSTQTVPGITLPTSNSTVTVSTQWSSNTCQGCGATTTSYQLDFDLTESNKVPVAATLTSGPNMIDTSGAVAIDLGNSCNGCGNSQLQYSTTIPGGAPNVGDAYNFTVTYSDGTQDTGSTVNTAVTGWNGGTTVVGASNAPTNLAPNANSSTSTTPTFTWTDASSATGSGFEYSFYLSNQTSCSGNCTIWQIPGQDSKLNGFASSITSITWGTDPTGDTGNTPSVGSLTSGDVYSWQIQVQDSNGNEASTNVWYQP